MKEILFKAKKIDNKEWIEGGSIIQFLDNGVRSVYMQQFNTKCTCMHDDITDDILEFTNCRFCKVDPETVCRYTGLTDKNGKKIWENNICVVHRNDDEEDEYFIVKWDNKGARFILKGDILTVDFDYLYGWYECEIIGNIFDNPELLEIKR